MASARTVNLSHLASEMPGEAQIASSYRRLQRFFQHVDLGPDWSARLVVELLGLRAPWYLCLERTNWKVGRHDVNLLVLASGTGDCDKAFPHPPDVERSRQGGQFKHG